MHPRTEVPPLLNVPLAEIIDFLVETGQRIRNPGNPFVEECIDRMAATHVLPRAVLEAQVKGAAAYLDKREERVQRNSDSSGADDREKPMKAESVVGAINGHRLARTEPNGSTEKSIQTTDVEVKLGQSKMAAFSDGNFAVSLPPHQLIDEIGYRDTAVMRKLKATEKVH